jgi:hypothetical protein
MSTAVIIGIVVAILLILAMIGYAMASSGPPRPVPKNPALM